MSWAFHDPKNENSLGYGILYLSILAAGCNHRGNHRGPTCSLRRCWLRTWDQIFSHRAFLRGSFGSFLIERPGDLVENEAAPQDAADASDGRSWVDGTPYQTR